MKDMVFGNTPQISRGSKEILLEVVIRRPTSQGLKKRSVDRELEAWSTSLGPCEWNQLDCLKSVMVKSTSVEVQELLQFTET
jgi:elongator complex protein 5